MKKTRPAFFLLLSLGGLALALFSGYTLKTQPELPQVQLIVWGLFFFSGCMFMVRGLMAYQKYR